jgi:DNA-binding MarR family transcriptional regulator
MDDIRRIELAADKTRFKLLTLLLNEESYATKLAKDSKTERKTTSFHLKQLEDAGLIEGRYTVKDNKPIAIKSYKITPRGKKVYEHIVVFKG